MITFRAWHGPWGAAPYTACFAEYQAAVRGYSPWNEFKKEFSLGLIALVEFFPPVAIGLLWGLIWGLVAICKWVLCGFGVEFRKNREPDAATMLQRFRGFSRWAVAPQSILALSAGMIALAVAYYYVISLPAANRERLQLEKDIAAAAKAERESKEGAAQQESRDRENSFSSCERDAENIYWSYVKLNGKEAPNRRNTYIAPIFVWNTANKQKADAIAECHRQFDPKK